MNALIKTVGRLFQEMGFFWQISNGYGKKTARVDGG